MTKQRKKRARTNAQKEVRRSQILSAAEKLFNKQGRLASVAEISHEAKIVQGTLYLYFKTKEEIYLTLFGERLDSLFMVVDHLAAYPKSERAIAKIIKEVAAHLRKNSILLKLAEIHNGLLEANSSPELVVRIRSKVIMQIRMAAGMLCELFPELSRDQAFRFLQRAYGVIVGLWHISEPSSSTMELIKNRTELRPMDLKFEIELEETLLLFWLGFRTRSKSN